jgi:hypothetical protein
MSGRQWKFQTDGSITDGVNSVKFTELVKFNPATNRVEDISGNPAPIAVTDATTLNGLGGSSYLTKNETSVNGKGIISGNIDFSAIDMEEVVSQAMITYTGGGMHPNVPMTGLELLPNIDFTNTNNVVVENAANLSVASNKLRVTKSTVDNPVIGTLGCIPPPVYVIIACDTTSSISIALKSILPEIIPFPFTDVSFLVK